MSATEDRELERYLQRGDALSRAYAALKSERPSPALDQAVLARARDVLQGQPRVGKIRHRRWPAITALAATVLLSFALVMRIALEPDAQPERSPAPSPLESRRPVIETEIRAASEQAEQAPAIAEPVPPRFEPKSLERTESARAPAERATAGGLVAPSAQQETRQPAYAISPQSSTTQSITVTAQPSADVSSGTAVSSARMHDESLAKQESTKSPEVWLEEIEQLRAAGELEAAERELERFRAAYPGYLETHQDR